MSRYFYYSVYGLRVRSALLIPELPHEDEMPFDVDISFGLCPASFRPDEHSRNWAEFDSGQCLIKAPGIARFLVEDGQSITIDRREARDRIEGNGVPPADLRLYLLGSAFGAIIHQRGLVPLHVGAVQSNSAVWAFTGESGAGKSTLVGCLSQRFNYPMLTDDVAVVTMSGDEAILHPGPRKLKLWKEAVDYLGFENHRMDQDLSGTEKYQVYLNEERSISAQKMVCLIELERLECHAPPSLQRLSGAEALRVLIGALYRPAFAQRIRKPQHIMKDMVTIANRIRVYRFSRSWDLRSLETGCESIVSLIDRYGQNGHLEDL